MGLAQDSVINLWPTEGSNLGSSFILFISEPNDAACLHSPTSLLPKGTYQCAENKGSHVSLCNRGILLSLR